MTPGTTLPLLIAVDQEGGRVARMGPPWTVWPPLRALGRIGSEDLARRMGAALAAECASAGIKCDFAPIMDVDTNPDNPIIGNRSFGDDPELVGRLGVAMIEGLQGGGVVASAKHFPGHGDTERGFPSRPARGGAEPLASAKTSRSVPSSARSRPRSRRS